jgi:hypothetical protein
LEIFFLFFYIRIGFSDYAKGALFFGHEFDIRRLFQWRGKRKIATSTNS